MQPGRGNCRPQPGRHRLPAGDACRPDSQRWCPLNGVVYVAQGRGAHATVVFLHGFPGDQKNADLAQAVRRAGFNALVFHYRGAWGSPGTYSYSHVLEDVTAALTWLRDPTTVDSMRIDPKRLILVGHSLG